MKYDDKNSLGSRMKQNYESVFKYKLPERTPVIIRLDGRAFHTLTSKADKPFDLNFIELMNETTKYLCENIQGTQIAYIQSDEISILLHNYKKLDSQSWFNNEIQKMCSISAGLASSFFTYQLFGMNLKLKHRGYTFPEIVQFDSRCFVLPESEVNNYFVWRQKDWERNSVQMLAQSLYSHKELMNKNNSELQEMCFQKGKNWNNLSINLKRGRCCIYKAVHKKIDFEIYGTDLGSSMQWVIDNNIPIFTQDRNYIEKYLEVEGE